jgi:hypothetical protein
MATRSSIAVKTDNGIRSIYCHWNGFPDYNGAVLNEHYTSPEKIAQLIDLGDLSYLSDEVGTEPQDFNNPNSDITLAYGRDRGETDVDAVTHPNIESWADLRKSSGCEYGYLWENGSWATFEW